MIRNLEKEKEYFSKDVRLSYSSLNLMIYSPVLFYKQYILNEKEESLAKYLIEGSLLHCQLFEPENLTKKFKITPGKLPSENVRKVLIDMMKLNQDAISSFKIVDDSDILDAFVLSALKQNNLFQSLKTDAQRLEKIKNLENSDYWEFLKNSSKNIVDQAMVDKAKERAEELKRNQFFIDYFEDKGSDFDLDPVEFFVEKKLEGKIKDFPFNLLGFIDSYKIDNDKEEVLIVDFKTTGKGILNFHETVEYYNLWLQCAIYVYLIYYNHPEVANYKIKFVFAVVDENDQFYPYEVSEKTLSEWAERFKNVLNMAKYHFEKRDFSLPYELLSNKITL